MEGQGLLARRLLLLQIARSIATRYTKDDNFNDLIIKGRPPHTAWCHADSSQRMQSKNVGVYLRASRRANRRPSRYQRRNCGESRGCRGNSADDLVTRHTCWADNSSRAVRKDRQGWTSWWTDLLQDATQCDVRLSVMRILLSPDNCPNWRDETKQSWWVAMTIRPREVPYIEGRKHGNEL